MYLASPSSQSTLVTLEGCPEISEIAKKNFENGRKNVNEVMYDVGYTDPKAFRTTFKKITGLSPVEYRSKYNKEAFVA